jgi:hypothetical protein
MNKKEVKPAKKTAPAAKAKEEPLFDPNLYSLQIGKALSQQALNDISSDVGEAMEDFGEYAVTFRPIDRMRKIGAGNKNYGFIQSAIDSAEANEKLVPPYLNLTEYRTAITDFEHKRVLLLQLKQFVQVVSDSMLDSSNAAYHFSLQYYNALREAAKQRIPGAEALYKALLPFFKKRKNPNRQPTEHEIERDLRNVRY